MRFAKVKICEYLKNYFNIANSKPCVKYFYVQDLDKKVLNCFHNTFVIYSSVIIDLPVTSPLPAFGTAYLFFLTDLVANL